MVTQQAKSCKCGSCVTSYVNNIAITFTGNVTVFEIPETSLSLSTLIVEKTGARTRIDAHVIPQSDYRLIQLENKTSKLPEKV